MELLVNPGAEILVFVPNWIQAGTGPARLSHLLIPVVGALHAGGYTVRLLQEAFDGAPDPTWSPWLERAAVAVVWCAEMYPAVQIESLRRFVGECGGSLPVVVGGGFFQLVDTASVAMDPRVTAIVHGPGEVVLPRLIEAVRRGADLGDVPGITYRGNDCWIATKPARRLPLDPAFLHWLHEVDLRPYLHAESEIFGNDAPSLQLHTGSGCAKRCRFCFDEHTPYGLFPAETIVDALAALHRRYALRQVLFGELDFFHKTARALAVANGVIERGVNLRWFALGSVVDMLRLTDPQLATLAMSGCHRVEMGSESGSDAMLARLGKRHAARDVLRAVERLAGVGIATTHNLLLGTPGETAADRRATIQLAFAIRRRDRRAHLHFRAYQLIPRTSLGASVLDQVPDFPRTLVELRDYRFGIGAGRRALPWLDPDAERWVSDLTSYLGPMAFHRPDGREPWPTSTLRVLARLRCRTGFRAGLSFERRLRQRLAVRLSGTFVP